MKRLFLALAGGFFIPLAASAHEAYVLPQPFFWDTLSGSFNFGALEALKSFDNLIVTLEITIGIAVLIVINFLFRLSSIGEKTHAFFERFASYGPLFVRVAIAAAFFLGARSGEFLGPELPLSTMPYAELLQAGLYAASIMILFGIFTEIAALIGLVIFSLGYFAFGAYLFTYLNYLGELVTLLLFGLRRRSFDRLFFGPLEGWRRKWEPYETTIIRVFYGLALIYAAVTVKLLHPAITLKVVNDWNLTQFHFLFPSDPLLVVFGAAIAEITIGLFILIGFEMRMTILISLFYITMSLLFFKELVWPHILLYGISFNLLVQPEILTLDHFIFKRHRRFKTIWSRLFSSHRDIEPLRKS